MKKLVRIGYVRLENNSDASKFRESCLPGGHQRVPASLQRHLFFFGAPPASTWRRRWTEGSGLSGDPDSPGKSFLSVVSTLLRELTMAFSSTMSIYKDK